MEELPVRILSNMNALDQAADEGMTSHQLFRRDAGFLSGLSLFWKSFHYDVILVDGNQPALWLLCLLRWIWPFGSCKVIALDIMFVQPVSKWQCCKAWIHKLLLKQVDHFIHYFKDLEGYSRHFGIGWDRSTYMPFKVNAWEQVPPARELSSDGLYVFTGGRSLRDVATFARAMQLVPYPGLLLYHDRERMKRDGTFLSLEQLPQHVRAIEDDGSPTSWITHLRDAKVVVIPTLPNVIRAIGISSYLDAMALKKCVIISEGPATRDILTDEAIIVPPGDPQALAKAIRDVWEDDALREQTAAAGRNYVAHLHSSRHFVTTLLAVCRRVAGKDGTAGSFVDCPAGKPVRKGI